MVKSQFDVKKTITALDGCAKTLQSIISLHGGRKVCFQSSHSTGNFSQWNRLVSYLISCSEKSRWYAKPITFPVEMISRSLATLLFFSFKMKNTKQLVGQFEESQKLMLNTLTFFGEQIIKVKYAKPDDPDICALKEKLITVQTKIAKARGSFQSLFDGNVYSETYTAHERKGWLTWSSTTIDVIEKTDTLFQDLEKATENTKTLFDVMHRSWEKNDKTIAHKLDKVGISKKTRDKVTEELKSEIEKKEQKTQDTENKLDDEKNQLSDIEQQLRSKQEELTIINKQLDDKQNQLSDTELQLRPKKDKQSVIKEQLDEKKKPLEPFNSVGTFDECIAKITDQMDGVKCAPSTVKDRETELQSKNYLKKLKEKKKDISLEIKVLENLQREFKLAQERLDGIKLGPENTPTSSDPLYPAAPAAPAAPVAPVAPEEERLPNLSILKEIGAEFPKMIDKNIEYMIQFLRLRYEISLKLFPDIHADSSVMPEMSSAPTEEEHCRMMKFLAENIKKIYPVCKIKTEQEQASYEKISDNDLIEILQKKKRALEEKIPIITKEIEEEETRKKSAPEPKTEAVKEKPVDKDLEGLDQENQMCLSYLRDTMKTVKTHIINYNRTVNRLNTLRSELEVVEKGYHQNIDLGLRSPNKERGSFQEPIEIAFLSYSEASLKKKDIVKNENDLSQMCKKYQSAIEKLEKFVGQSLTEICKTVDEKDLNGHNRLCNLVRSKIERVIKGEETLGLDDQRLLKESPPKEEFNMQEILMERMKNRRNDISEDESSEEEEGSDWE